MGNCFKSQTTDVRHSLLQEDGTNIAHNDLPPPYQEETVAPVFNLTPTFGNSGSTSLTEEQQVRIAQRLGLIHHLPIGTFDGTKKKKECVICMCDFIIGDSLRFLPCLHTYHRECIDDWLLRSFSCPSCMEPVDAALISSFFTSE